MKNFFSDKVVLIDSLIIILPFIGFYIIGIQNNNLHPEFLVNSVFIALLLNQLIFRSNSIRHMYFAFVFLILTIIGDLLGLSNFVYTTSSFVLELLILGILNLLLFINKDSNI